MLSGRCQGEQLDHIHVPHFQLGDVLTQDFDRRKAFLGGDVTGGGQHHIRFIQVGAAVVVAGPVPDANAFRHMATGLVQCQVLQMFLLVANDDVGDVGLR